jgi:ribulose 1,5-bisphosphate carboxylase large subunit-like protein
VTEGVKAMRQAYDAAMQGVDVDVYAKEYHELTAALAAF